MAHTEPFICKVKLMKSNKMPCIFNLFLIKIQHLLFLQIKPSVGIAITDDTGGPSNVLSDF